MSDNWDLDGPGITGMDEAQPAPQRSRAKRTSPYTRLYRAWKDAMSETMVVAVNPPRAIFNKHIKDLLGRTDEESIARAFLRFAGDLNSGRVRIKNNAWFTFYGRREKYIISQRSGLDGKQADWSDFNLEYNTEPFELPEGGWQ